MTTTAAPAVAEVYLRASAEFSARLRAADGLWAAPTPCADWDVRALVRHVVEEERWVAPLLRGETIEEVGDRFAGDLLGDDPVRAAGEEGDLVEVEVRTAGRSHVGRPFRAAPVAGTERSHVPVGRGRTAVRGVCGRS